MKDEREGMLHSYKVIGGKYWQEKSFEALNKRLVKHPLHLLVIQGWIILKREEMTRSKKGLNKKIWILV